jgi:cephalosporin hydroxylase
MITKLKNLSRENLQINSNSRLFKIYKNLKYESLKCITYFQAYEELLSKYVGKEIVFVEIGVLHGGSLFMWKEYFGDKARIIGVDLNPSAKQLEKQGFEIFIGSQSDINFWKNFYSTVGKIDVLLDDGGHDNDQQIITLHESIPNINNGGTILVEDTHASYMKKHGNPSKHSFINYSKYLIDVVNSRFPATQISKKNKFREKIFSISFYESIVALKIESEKSIENISLFNETKNLDNMHDMYRLNYFPKTSKFINKHLPYLHNIPVIKKIVRKVFFNNNLLIRIKNYLILKKYFK